MTENEVGTQATAGAPEFDSKEALKSVAISIAVNGVAPFVLYKILVPYFPAGSVMPLLYASAFPIVGLAVSFVRTRVVDAIAIIALFGIFYTVVTTLVAGEVRLALILGATQSFVVAAVFFASALAGRPVLFFIVRQFVAGNDPSRRQRFAAVNAADHGRTFYIATMAWVVGLSVIAGIGLALAMTLAPDTYLLVNNIVGTAATVALVVWTTRFVRPRMTAAAARLA